MKHVRVWGFLTGFTLLVAGFFYQTLLFQKLPVPSDTLVGLYHPWRDMYAKEFPRGFPFKNFLITDPVRQQIPWRKVVVDTWKQGERPGWNPYAFAGVPLDANIQAAPYYPLNALFLFLEFPVAWTLLIILQPLLSGTFLYFYLRNLKLSSVASSIGAISWAFGGFATSWLTWGTIMHTALWLPLILLSIDSLFERKKHQLLWGLSLGVAFVMTILGGHIQVAFYTLGLSTVYFFWRFKHIKNRTVLRWVVWSTGTAILLTAIQWLPTLKFLLESGRVGAMESWKNAGWFLPWQHLAQFIAPDFFGNPATLNYWGVWNYGEFVGFIGVIPMLLAVSAFHLKGLPRFFTITCIISLLFMLSHPVSQLPYQLHIPVFSVLQPTRLMVLVDFSFAVLAAFGMDQLLKKNNKYTWKSMIPIAIVFALLWVVVLVGRFVIADAEVVKNLAIAMRNIILPTLLFGGFVVWFGIWRWLTSSYVKQLGMAVLFIVIIFDLFRFGWKFTPFTPRKYFFPTTEIITFLQNQPKPFRVMSLDDRVLPPNMSAYYGIETIEGYDPVAPKRYDDFLAASERGNADITKKSGFNRIYTAHNIDSLLLPYFNVRYVLALSDIDRPFLREVMREGETRVYEYSPALPRVYLAEKVIMSSKPSDALSVLFTQANSRLGIYEGTTSLMNLPLLGGEGVRVTSYTSNQVKLKVSATNQRLLVILNRYDSRWQATIDGVSSSRIIPVNYLFMGLVMPSGTHDVILSYH